MDRRRHLPRAQRLDDLGVLRELPSLELTRTARLAAHIAQHVGGRPHAAVHLFDEAHQHRVAAAPGVPLTRTPSQDSMCVQVLSAGRAVYCSDATTSELFLGNPFTTAAEPVRLYYSTPLRLSDGSTVGTLCVFDTAAAELDLEQRERLDDLALQAGAHIELSGLSRDLLHLATHDPLTGCANRSLLSQRLDAALQDPARAPHEPALILVDLDDFKAVNDALGHQVGDEVLLSTTDRLRRAVRQSDLVARIGGDEFAVLLPELPDADRLEQLAQRVGDVMRLPHRTQAGEVTCTVSVGRTLGQPADLAYELLGRADADMYARKRSPRTPAPRRSDASEPSAARA